MVDTEKYTEEQLKNGAQYYATSVNGVVVDDTNVVEYKVKALRNVRETEESTTYSLLNTILGTIIFVSGLFLYSANEGLTQREIYNNQPKVDKK